MLAGLERLVPARERFSLRARDGLPVGLSILLHAAVIAAALQLPRPSQLVELRVVDVEFVAPQPEALPEPPPPEPVQELVQEPPPPEPPPPEPVQVAEAPPPPPPPPPPELELPVVQPPEPEILPPVVFTPPPPPPVEPEPVQPPRAVTPPPQPRRPPPVAQRPVDPAPRAPAPAAPSGPPVAAAPPVVRAVGNAMDLYASGLKRLIEARKQYPPQSLRRGEQGMVELLVTIAPDGALVDAKVKSEPNSRLGGAALAAVRAAAPFPRFPPGLPTAVTTFTSQIEFKIE